MGLDFIRSVATKPWRKKWNLGVDTLKHPTLFDLQITAADYIVTMDCAPEGVFSPGTEYVVEVENDCLVVKENHRVIGRVDNPPQTLLDDLCERAGVGVGTLKRLGTFPGTAELAIR